MSMLASIAQISQTYIDAILRDPGCVGDLLDLPETPKDSKPGFLERLFFGKRSSRQVSSKRIPELTALPDDEIFHVDGFWHILHFLFTGTAWEGQYPGSFLVSGGLPVGRDFGYGAPRLFDPGQVQAISEFLGMLTFEEFSVGYDIKNVTDAEIYWQPGSTSDDWIADLESLWGVVGEMRRFIADGVKQGNGILVEIY
jgi:hypothetical protein